MEWFKKNKKETKGPEESIREQEARSFTLPSKGVVMKVYLQNFKSLNKSFGYDYCEELLSLITAYLKEAAHGNVFRYIGVEFMIVLEDAREGQACDLAAQILERFGHVWTVWELDCVCSAQIGICSCPAYGADMTSVLKNLDAAVSAAEEYGPNQYAVFDSKLHEQVLRRQAIARYLQTALEKNEIEVRYRPIAEDSEQIRAVGYYALEDAGRLIARLMEEGKEFESICIPVSPLLLTQEDFIDKVEDVITRFHIPSGKLALELDDTALSSVYLNVNITMQELAHLGVELVLNHFGSGCVPVTGILDLPVNTVKLERMFVWQLETNPSCAAIAGGLIQIAKNLNIHIIAEGVETENQFNTLNGYECEYQQGFYYAPTMEKETLIKVLGCTLEESRITVEEEKKKMAR